MPVVKTIKKLAEIFPMEHQIEGSLPERIHLGCLRKRPPPDPYIWFQRELPC